MHLVRERAPQLMIVILADDLDPVLLRFALDERVNGLLMTNASGKDVAQSLTHVVHGHAVLPAGWQRALALKTNDPVGSLSERQFQVLQLLAEGHSYEDIGARLYISPNTVKYHVRSIYLRLGVRNRTAAARVLAQHSGRGASRPTGSPT